MEDCIARYSAEIMRPWAGVAVCDATSVDLCTKIDETAGKRCHGVLQT